MLHLTPDMLRAAYALLCTTPPFRRWKMPDAEAVKFVVTRDRNCCGKAWVEFDAAGMPTYCISISAELCGQLATVLATMGHEMIHIYQAIAKRETRKTEHNADFRRLAGRVCRHHGFDRKAFG